MYKLEKILTPTDINNLNELCDYLPGETLERRYNLNKIHITYVDGLYYSMSAIKKCNQKVGLKLRNVYFLDYFKDSWTNMHVDAHDKETSIGKTIITVLKDDNLIGGESLLGIGMENGQEQIIVENPVVGDSLIYDTNQRHGVGLVKGGTRRVMVQWYYE